MRVRINSLTKYGMQAKLPHPPNSWPIVGQEYEGTLIPAVGMEKECVMVNGYYIHPDDYVVINEEVTK